MLGRVLDLLRSIEPIELGILIIGIDRGRAFGHERTLFLEVITDVIVERGLRKVLTVPKKDLDAPLERERETRKNGNGKASR